MSGVNNAGIAGGDPQPCSRNPQTWYLFSTH